MWHFFRLPKKIVSPAIGLVAVFMGEFGDTIPKIPLSGGEAFWETP
jgi:hypothetical protein